jgi:hypothetical protein
MGWLFLYSMRTRQDLVRHLRRPERFGESVELVQASTRGNHHWYLMRERATGQHWIGLDLMQSSTDGWGYKDMDETVGPCAVDCPLAYLDAPHAERDGWAAQWRERVREYHAKLTARPELAPGLVVDLAGWSYTLRGPAGPRRGWYVSRSDGTMWRMNARQLRAASIRGAASC